jgi:hypothetical protein
MTNNTAACGECSILSTVSIYLIFYYDWQAQSSLNTTTENVIWSRNQGHLEVSKNHGWYINYFRYMIRKSFARLVLDYF